VDLNYYFVNLQFTALPIMLHNQRKIQHKRLERLRYFKAFDPKSNVYTNFTSVEYIVLMVLNQHFLFRRQKLYPIKLKTILNIKCFMGYPNFNTKASIFCFLRQSTKKNSV
jgi:hypothetical protein